MVLFLRSPLSNCVVSKRLYFSSIPLVYYAGHLIDNSEREVLEITKVSKGSEEIEEWTITRR